MKKFICVACNKFTLSSMDRGFCKDCMVQVEADWDAWINQMKAPLKEGENPYVYWEVE